MNKKKEAPPNEPTGRARSHSALVVVIKSLSDIKSCRCLEFLFSSLLLFRSIKRHGRNTLDWIFFSETSRNILHYFDEQFEFVFFFFFLQSCNLVRILLPTRKYLCLLFYIICWATKVDKMTEKRQKWMEGMKLIEIMKRAAWENGSREIPTLAVERHVDKVYWRV